MAHLAAMKQICLCLLAAELAAAHSHRNAANTNLESSVRPNHIVRGRRQVGAEFPTLYNSGSDGAYYDGVNGGADASNWLNDPTFASANDPMSDQFAGVGDSGAFGDSSDLGMFGSSSDTGSFGSSNDIGAFGGSSDIGTFGGSSDIGTFGGSSDIGTFGDSSGMAPMQLLGSPDAGALDDFGGPGTTDIGGQDFAGSDALLSLAAASEPGSDDSSLIKCVGEAKFSVFIRLAWRPELLPDTAVTWDSLLLAAHNSSNALWALQDMPSEELANYLGDGDADMLQLGLTYAGKTNDFSDIKAVSLMEMDETGADTFVYANDTSRLFSFVARIDPTSDWFTGVSGIDLCNETTGEWNTHIQLDLDIYDGGVKDEIISAAETSADSFSPAASEADSWPVEATPSATPADEFVTDSNELDLSNWPGPQESLMPKEFSSDVSQTDPFADMGLLFDGQLPLARRQAGFDSLDAFSSNELPPGFSFDDNLLAAGDPLSGFAPQSDPNAFGLGGVSQSGLGDSLSMNDWSQVGDVSDPMSNLAFQPTNQFGQEENSDVVTGLQDWLSTQSFDPNNPEAVSVPTGLPDFVEAEAVGLTSYQPITRVEPSDDPKSLLAGLATVGSVGTIDIFLAKTIVSHDHPPPPAGRNIVKYTEEKVAVIDEDEGTATTDMLGGTATTQDYWAMETGVPNLDMMAMPWSSEAPEGIEFEDPISAAGGSDAQFPDLMPWESTDDTWLSADQPSAVDSSLLPDYGNAGDFNVDSNFSPDSLPGMDYFDMPSYAGGDLDPNIFSLDF